VLASPDQLYQQHDNHCANHRKWCSYFTKSPNLVARDLRPAAFREVQSGSEKLTTGAMARVPTYGFRRSPKGLGLGPERTRRLWPRAEVKPVITVEKLRAEGVGDTHAATAVPDAYEFQICA
jgi:hypothetical protein